MVLLLMQRILAADDLVTQGSCAIFCDKRLPNFDMPCKGMTQNLQENSAQDEGLLTRHEAARHLKISTRKLRYEVKAGRIPFVQLGRNVRFIPIDLEAYVQSRRIG